MRKIIIAVMFLSCTLLSNAQYNSVGLYNPHFSFNKAEMIPSLLGDNSASFEMRILPNIYVSAGNSFMSVQDLLYPNTEAIDKSVSDLDNDVLLGVGAELPFLAFSYKIKRKKKEFMTISLSNRTRVLESIVLGSNLTKLLWDGNKQFEGQTVSLGRFAVSALAITEISFGWAMPIKLTDKLKMRAGVNIKYILSGGGVYMQESEPTMETEEGGKRIKINNLDYNLNTALADDDEMFTGSGYGFDVSGTVNIADKLVASAAVLDIGSISYNQNTLSYSHVGNVEYEGVQVGNIFDNQQVENDADFFEDENWVVEDSNQTFSIPLPTRMVIQLEKNIMSNTNKKNDSYIKHGIYLTYIQGFGNTAGRTKRPYFSAGYSYSLKNILDVGPTFNYGGIAGFGMGMFFSVKAGPFRIGAATNTGLMYLIAPGTSRSVDFSFLSTWSFGHIDKKK